MALTTTDFAPAPFYDDRKPLANPPPTAVTPCDPWPRPYYLEGGLRRVAPYHFTYNTYCKQRWRGRELLDIFAAEFRDRTREYYKHAIETGQMSVNGKPCKDVHTIVENGDVISHTLHRHEPPVTAQPIRVVHETDDMIVIDKPAGVPVHPAGRYNYNSVVEIMKAERHFAFKPLPCNRLDRLTSGVMFIGKTSKEAEAFSEKLRGRTVRKEYVARVKGRFPNGEDWDGNAMRGGIVKCDEAILQISPILGLNRARASGKSAKTFFRRLAYYPSVRRPPTTSTLNASLANRHEAAQPADSTVGTEDYGYSIVHCLPLTGRTHQIRVHLQFLGHPITNDPIYSNRAVFGPNLAKNEATGENDEEIIAKLKMVGKTEVSDSVSYEQERLSKMVNQTQQMTVSAAAQLNAISQSLNSPEEDPYFKPLNAGTMHAGSLAPVDGADADAEYGAFVKAHDVMVANYNKRKGEKMTGEKCFVCDTPLYSDPGPHELGIYLHALSYADVVEGSWSYRSPAPQWALPPDNLDGPQEIEPWAYRGDEVLDIGDETEDAKVKDRMGQLKNKGQVD